MGPLNIGTVNPVGNHPPKLVSILVECNQVVVRAPLGGVGRVPASRHELTRTGDKGTIQPGIVTIIRPVPVRSDRSLVTEVIPVIVGPGRPDIVHVDIFQPESKWDPV